jgi:NADH-quinone oxidoreductase subunit G
MGANIRVDARGNEVMRVLPRVHDEVNEEWISDKTRFACDGLMRQRLDRPYVRRNGRLQEASWGEALAVVADRLKSTAPERIGAIAGDLQDAESMYATLGLFRALGVRNLDCRQDGAKLGVGPRGGWLFNSTFSGLESCDALLLVGTNPRREAPVLNARIRKRWLNGKLSVGVIGEQLDLTYHYEHIGGGPRSLDSMAHGRFAFEDVLANAAHPAIIVGQGALVRPDGAAILRLAAAAAERANMVREGWNGFNVLHTAAARVGGLDLGFVPGEGGLDVAGMLKPGALDVLFLLGADECDARAAEGAFVVYLGSHGDAGANRADVILPGAAYTEKSGLYVSTEGRVQIANRAVFPKGDAKEDWAILRALSERVGPTLPYDSLADLRARLFAEHPTFGRIDYVTPDAPLDLSQVGVAGEIDPAPFGPHIRDFFQTNPIARASPTMAECSALAARPTQLMAAE